MDVSVKSLIKKQINTYIPLSIRKQLAITVNRQSWLDPKKCSWWAAELVSDYSVKDINAYHKFLWGHHLSYAETYEINLRFGYANLNETRKVLFKELVNQLSILGISSEADIKSIFEVGCSLGYLLHYLETDIFLGASLIEGTDIDKYSIEEGTKYLASKNSKVKLIHADMEDVDELVSGKTYDVVLGAGILLYLKQEDANKLVEKMMKLTKTMLVFTGLAHPDFDNSELDTSVIRERDKTWIHNIDKMITDAGGIIVYRRWEGKKHIDGNSIYFVFALPA